MSGPYINDFGDVTSSNLHSESYHHAEKDVFNENRIFLGQIQKAYAADDPENTIGEKGNFTLYDVFVRKPDGSTEIFRRCRMLQGMIGGGITHFEEVIHPDQGPMAQDALVGASLRPGAMVLVGFINGQRITPVILGTMPHPSALAIAKRPKKTKAPHYEWEFNGINFKVDKDGALQIEMSGPKETLTAIPLDPTLGPNSISIDKTGNISLKTNQEQEITIDRVTKKITIKNGPLITLEMDQLTGKIKAQGTDIDLEAKNSVTVNALNSVTVAARELNISAEQSINLSRGGLATEPFVLGGEFAILMTQLLTAISAHTHTYINTVGIPTPTTPPINAPAFASMIASPIANTKIFSKLIRGSA